MIDQLNDTRARIEIFKDLVYVIQRIPDGAKKTTVDVSLLYELLYTMVRKDGSVS